MLLNCGVRGDFWESLGLQGDQTRQFSRKSTLNVHWKDSCWSWNFNALATWCEELTHCKRPWCWERLKAGGEGDDTGWYGWMASSAQRTWVWVNSRSWRWAERPSMLQFTFIKRLFSLSSLSAITVVSSAYLRLLIFLPTILIPAAVSFSPHLSWCTLHIS